MTQDSPSYVERGGLQIFPQPWVITRGDFFGFILDAKRETIQAAICDPLFNGPMKTPHRFKPAGDFTMLVYNNLPHLVSAAPGWENKGVLAEHEMAFWTLVQDTQDDRLLWTQTYMIVDKGRAVSTGRETFGFPKEYGWVETPANAHSPDLFTTDTFVVPRFGSDDIELRKRLITVRRTGQGSPARELGTGLWGAARTLWDVLPQSGGILGAARTILNEIADQTNMRVPMIFLKQFRDVAEPARACFQSVTEAVTRMDRLHHGLLYFDRFEVEIGDWASHPVRDEFAFDTGPLTPRLAFWVNMDFTVEPGREIWRAGR